MMRAEIEILKKAIKNQTRAIAHGITTELDKRNIGGDTYQAKMVLEEVKRSHEIMYTKLSSITSNVNSRVVYDKPDFQYFFKFNMEKLEGN